MTETYCPECGADMAAKCDFCPACGQPVVTPSDLKEVVDVEPSTHGLG